MSNPTVLDAPVMTLGEEVTRPIPVDVDREGDAEDHLPIIAKSISGTFFDMETGEVLGSENPHELEVLDSDTALWAQGKINRYKAEMESIDRKEADLKAYFERKRNKAASALGYYFGLYGEKLETFKRANADVAFPEPVTHPVGALQYQVEGYLEILNNIDRNIVMLHEQADKCMKDFVRSHIGSIYLKINHLHAQRVRVLEDAVAAFSEFAALKLKNAKVKTFSSPFGKVSLRNSAGSCKVVDDAKAAEYLKAKYPEVAATAIAMRPKVLVGDISDTVRKMFMSDIDSPFVVTLPEENALKYDTGVKLPKLNVPDGTDLEA